jgi:low temperature requirement protein LtrA
MTRSTPDDTVRQFKRWFWRPPRSHGESIVDRRVSNLELLYDLVYVAVIGQASHGIGEEATAGAFAAFAVVFGLIWIAWVNGSLYLELHGREDGRTRSIVFVQMGILALLAVFSAEAAGERGGGFGIVYALFLGFTAVLWAGVQQQDRLNHPEFIGVTGRYIAAIAVSAAVVLASSFLPIEPRLLLWAATIAGWIALILVQGRARVGLEGGVIPTESLVERFGLFTIIVLGEVVIGVVAGLSGAIGDPTTIATGLLGLVLGFGFWWIYFDVLGGRLPKPDGPSLANWTLSHLPITLAIASAGAAMVSLIEHGHDAATPAAISMALGGAVAIGLVGEVVATRSIADSDRLPEVYGPLRVAMLAGAGAAIAIGLLQPAPWLLTLLLVGVLTALWLFAVGCFLRAGAWGGEPRQTEHAGEIDPAAG